MLLHDLVSGGLKERETERGQRTQDQRSGEEDVAMEESRVGSGLKDALADVGVEDRSCVREHTFVHCFEGFLGTKVFGVTLVELTLDVGGVGEGSEGGEGRGRGRGENDEEGSGEGGEVTLYHVVCIEQSSARSTNRSREKDAPRFSMILFLILLACSPTSSHSSNPSTTSTLMLFPATPPQKLAVPSVSTTAPHWLTKLLAMSCAA